MTMTVQPRHIKLLLAGHEQNWAYAKYELHELAGGVRSRACSVWPRYKGLPLGGMVDAIAKGPMAELSPPSTPRTNKFTAAYEKLTEGCNACHQAANVGKVVIKVPDASSFPDQDFRP